MGGADSPALTPADFCFGVWPSRGGQSLYKNDCYGHDEPGLSAYSSLPGSGGNVSWSFTLPTGRDATHNQSDLYGTFWFGMVLADSHSALGQAFLELQFYPDHTWTSRTTVNGNWIGAARVIQADLQTGYLDDAYVSPLLIGGVPGQYLNMHEGDAIDVNLSGWIHNPQGESVVVRDRTLGTEADHRLYNLSGGYPLNPSYSTNSFADALMWTNTGAPAVSFSFETGHAENPSVPGNSSFSGCTPGPPPSTPRNPSVPCPSYDPSSWANDTGAPLRLAPPVFWNGSTRATASELEIVDPVGGASAIDALSNDTCRNREGSAYCSYPWFSYSCSYRAFEFGATNYPETSVDFGKYGAYTPTSTQSAEQFQYYLPQRFAVPSCGASAYSLNLSVAGAGGGTVQFLREDIRGAASVSGLIAGNYSLMATPSLGEVFAGWTSSNGVIVADPKSPWTSVVIQANGSLTASFASTGSMVRVTLGSSGCPGRIAVTPGVVFNPAIAPKTLAGGSMDLSPGIYSIQAMADPGCQFVGWNWDPSAVELSDGGGLVTWIVVTGALPSFVVTAILAPTSQPTALWLFLRGVPGTVVFNGSSYTRDTRLNLSAGTYSVSSIPRPGNPVASITSGIAVNSLDLRSSGNVTVAPGTLHSLTFRFNQTVGIRVNGSMPGGRFSIGGGSPSYDGVTIPVEQMGPTEYPLLALPPPGERLTGWKASPTGALWPNPFGTSDTLLVNDSGNLTAQFVAAPPVSLSVDISIAQTGAVRLDLASTLINGTGSFAVAPGTHIIQAVPNPGFVFSGWGTQGSANVVPGGTGAWGSRLDRLIVNPGSPVLDAFFVPVTYPVTFVSSPPGVSATVGSTPVMNGANLELAIGSYAIMGTLPSGGTVGGWTSSPGLSLGRTAGNFSVVVTGPGTIYASGAGNLDGVATAIPGSGAAPLMVAFRVLPFNGTPPYAFSWAFGDGSNGSGSAPVHTYSWGGNYVVQVWINDSTSASARRSLSLAIAFAPLAPIMSTNVTAGFAPLWVAFNGSASGGLAPYLFQWDFGDGFGSATGGHASYEFSRGGNFTVTLTVVDAFGHQSNATQLVSVRPTAPLFVVVQASLGNLTLGSSVRFVGVVSGGRPPYRYIWSAPTPDCAASVGAELECTPSTTGAWTVGLQAIDAGGASSSASATVNVAPSGGGQGAPPVGLLGLPEPYGLALIAGVVALALGVAAFLVLRPGGGRRQTPARRTDEARSEREVPPAVSRPKK